MNEFVSDFLFLVDNWHERFTVVKVKSVQPSCLWCCDKSHWAQLAICLTGLVLKLSWRALRTSCFKMVSARLTEVR